MNKWEEKPLAKFCGTLSDAETEEMQQALVEGWTYFLPQEHENFPVPGKEYRIFSPQSKCAILSWLGCADVADQKKEEFIAKLVNFDDGCYGNFYGYRAYFLPAAGISQFKSCSLADAIVEQIVTWGFGQFNVEKQEWHIFPNALAIGARKTISETDKKRVIEKLSNLLNFSQCREDTRRTVAESLGKLDPGNKDAIAALVQMLEETNDEHARCWTAYTLEQIAQGNQEAIAALVQLLKQTECKDTRYRAAYSLGKIDPGHQEAIAVLVQLLMQTEDEDIFYEAIGGLGEIGQGNVQVISALIQLLEKTEDEEIRWQVAESLGQIIITEEQQKIVVSGLQRHFNSQTDEKNGDLFHIQMRTTLTYFKFDRFSSCYQLLWDIAQSLSYAEFYQAWHSSL
ncbi:HEAT repeat domain-containing protein [Roseofilum sp. Guam]|uniref:HEAT repeat domain-containing protein n=1 Tax=Roseofilum sp. Guam TaxID=2821502 RepID=UPI001B0F3822|nr:HEAT repeat domain-containing protein [Roseofilum sp. Guam]MBP0029710.1 HEAT repeat domain-containing protein [Roseofilum sp. Guam]